MRTRARLAEIFGSSPRMTSGVPRQTSLRDFHRDRVACRKRLLDALVEPLVQILLRVLGQLTVLLRTVLAGAVLLRLVVLVHRISPSSGPSPPPWTTHEGAIGFQPQRKEM